MNKLCENQCPLYDLSPKTLIPATASVFLATIILNQQQLLLRLPRPAILLLTFLAFFSFTCLLAERIASFVVSRKHFVYPTVRLWLYPTLAMFMVTLFLFTFINLSNFLLGRGFWSSWLGLTGQDTTSFFFGCFASMITFVALQFIWSTYLVFSWIIGISRQHMQIARPIGDEMKDASSINTAMERLKLHSEDLKLNRIRATRLNRAALFTLFCLSVGFTLWITFFKPELILYYRAEIQLRTFLEPQAAYETFKHLSEKFPNYKFMDSVKYRMSWILDRRLEDYGKARDSYVDFLKKYGYKNVWSDEAIASLVRLNLDKLNNPQQALFWAEIFLQNHPDEVMSPHMLLYRIRALNSMQKPEEAMLELKQAKEKHRHLKMQLINSEDRLFGLIAFDEILTLEEKALKKQFKSMQN